MDDTYPKAPDPTPRQRLIRWLVKDKFVSVKSAAVVMNCSETEVELALDLTKDWIQGIYNDRYEEALSVGMPESDAHLHAQQEVAFRLLASPCGRGSA